MKKFYNHQTIKIEEHDDFNTFQFQIEVPMIFGLEVYEELDKKIQKYVKQLNSNKPTLFQIVGNFDVLENANKDEIQDFLEALINLFVSDLISDKKVSREKRLGLYRYPDLAKANLRNINKMGIINYEIKFPVFQLEIIDTHDKVIMSVF
jgi:hypothetical protein